MHVDFVLHWINQLNSYNLRFVRDVMRISNIPLDATKFSVYQILFHYDYSWFYEWYLVTSLVIVD